MAKKVKLGAGVEFYRAVAAFKVFLTRHVLLLGGACPDCQKAIQRVASLYGEKSIHLKNRAFKKHIRRQFRN